MQAGQLLIDISSLKSATIEAMLRSPAEVLGLHPMFAPDAGGFEHQTVIAVPARSGAKTRLVLDLLSRKGANVTTAGAEEHDRLMAVIQGLTHFSAIATAAAIKELAVNIEETLPFASPMYRLRMGMVGRIMAQDPALYADIALYNPHTTKVLQTLQQTSERLFRSISTADRVGFVRIFEEASQHLGSFRREAMIESSNIIKRMK